MRLFVNKNIRQHIWNAIVKLFSLFVVLYLIVLLLSIDDKKKVDIPLVVSVIYILSLFVSAIDNFISLWDVRKEKVRYYFIGLVPLYVFFLYTAFKHQEFFNYKIDFYFTMLYVIAIILLMARYLIIKLFEKV